MRLRSPLIAEQASQIAAGIVRTDTGSGRVLALVVIGKLSPGMGLELDPSRKAWCDISSHSQRYACFQDLDSDGRLETSRFVASLGYSQPLTIALAGPPTRLPTPVPYRAASDTELPSYRLVYESCVGKGAGSVDDARFVQRVRNAGGGGIDYACEGKVVRLTGRPGQAGTLRVDRMVVKAVPKAQSADTELVSGITAGTLLDRIMPGEPVANLGDRFTLGEEAQRENERTFPFTLSEPTSVKEGELSSSDFFLEGRLRWSYTGRTISAWSDGMKTIVAPGSFVYGVPVSESIAMEHPTSTPTTEMMWCAPDLRGKRWWATCVTGVAGPAPLLIKNVLPSLVVSRVSMVGSGKHLEGPVEIRDVATAFEREAALKYRVIGCWQKRAYVSAGVDTAGSVLDGQLFSVYAGKDGVVRFGLGGGVVEVAPTAAGRCSIRLAQPVTAGGTALPMRVADGGPVGPMN